MILPLYLREPIAGDSGFFGSLFGTSFSNLLLIILLIFMIVGFVVSRQYLINHWSVLLKGLEYSPQDFYEKLKTEIETEEVEGLSVNSEKRYQGASVFSSRRYYATIKWKDYSYSVCAAPFAKSFFISYRSLSRENRMESAVLYIPFIGKYLARFFFTPTWYQEDTIIMFHRIVHESVVKVVNDITEEKGIERLTEHQKIPKMRDIFKR